MFIKDIKFLSYKRLAVRYIKVAAFAALGVLTANISTVTDTATLIIILKTALVAGLIALLEKWRKELKA